MFAGAEMQPDILLAAQEAVDAQGIAIRLLEAHRIARRFGVAGIEHQPARGDQRHQRVLIDGEFVFAAGEKSQPRMEPMGLAAGEQFNAFVGERIRGEEIGRASCRERV